MSDQPKRPRGRPRKTAKITSSFKDLVKSDTTNLSSVHSDLRSMLTPQPMTPSELILQKSVKPVTIRKDLDGKFSQSKIVFSRQDNGYVYNNLQEKGYRRVSDEDLKELAQLDPYISAIISTRVSQAVTVGRPSNSKFDKGTRVLELKPLKLADFKDDKAAFKRAQDERANKMEAILEWFQNCGTSNIDVLNEIYKGNPDPAFKRCSMPDYIGSQVRNLLTFGRMARQNFFDENDAIVTFRPTPVETIRHWAFQELVSINTGEDTMDQSVRDAAEYNAMPKHERPAAFVQKIQGSPDNFFTDRDLVMSYFQKQALFDLNGYPLSPIEMALFMVYVHQQTLNYLRNQYVKGIGAKGMLVISSTDPTAQLGPEDMDELRSQFHNYISRNDNSASTPVLSGPIAVNYVSLSPTPRDMEFLQLEEHIVRSLCSAMQISPQEMGYGNLSQGQGGLQQANKQQEITQGEERGLRMLLDIVYDDLNQILIDHFPEAKDNFRLAYTGVGEDTKDSAIARATAEMQTTGTMASLFADSEKNVPIPIGGDVPLSPIFHSSVLRYLRYGVVMENYFGEVDASKKPEYDFIVDPQLNASYMALKTNPINKQSEQTELQLEGMSIQNETGKQQLQAGQQQAEQLPQEEPQEQQEDPMAQQKLAESQDQMDMKREAHEQKLRHLEENHRMSLKEAMHKKHEEKQMDKSEEPKEDATIGDALKEKAKADGPRSLADALADKKKLRKSITSSYFSSWLDSHRDK